MNMLRHASECTCSCHCWRQVKVTNLREHCFLVYDSLPSLGEKSRRELVDSAVSCLCVLSGGCTISLTLLTMFALVKRIDLVLAFLRSTTYADVGQWDVITPKCLKQMDMIAGCLSWLSRTCYPSKRMGSTSTKLGQVPVELSAGPSSSFPATSMRFVSNLSNLVTYPKLGMLVRNVDGDIVMCSSPSPSLYGGIDMLHRSLRLTYGELGIVSRLRRDMNIGDGVDSLQYRVFRFPVPMSPIPYVTNASNISTF
ncbi:hypothetical protein Cgig2_019852 [Carnegiea gigantea]|uniref:Uncharacterized protein n=1 Tax=Carnegiea gigantea TaxID=171969 RepID=A0A9Q1JJ57_9CARY|nr:hypothetical protein Cgig2_019852 [Carnegiea gigantea]